MRSWEWPQEIFNFARQKWEEGCSASIVCEVINKKFSTAFTRSAVIGKIHRYLNRRDTNGALAHGHRVTVHVKSKRTSASSPRERKAVSAPARKIIPLRAREAPLPVLHISDSLSWHSEGAFRTALRGNYPSRPKAVQHPRRT